MARAPQQSSRTRWLRLRSVLLWTTIVLSLILLAFAGWIRYRFGTVTFEQIVLNLPIDGGEGVGNNSLIVEALVYCIVLPLTVALIARLVWRAFRRRRATAVPTIETTRRRWPRTVLPIGGFVASLAVLLATAGVPQYAIAVLADRSFSEYYTTPVVTAEPVVKKNLVTIYLESMENTFEDSDLFGRNLLADLDTATQGWAKYDGLQQFPGGGWTMAGFVGTQCGIPLKSRALTPGVDPNIYGESVSQFLPGATCVGDILKGDGYTSVYLGGAAEGFAGKSTFLRDHGYSEVHGLSEWQNDPDDRSEISTQWGLSDHRLFAHAKTTIDQLRSEGKPFNLTMLTLDTHEPGQLYDSCSTDDENQMAAAMTCSLRAVSDFIDYLSDNGYLDDTVVVVMGDHLKGTGEGIHFSSELDSVADRTIVYRVWSPDGVTFSRPQADQFSVFASTLNLLGYSLENGRAGLGASFVGPYNLAGSALELPADEYDDVVTSPSSDIYRAFWNGQE